MRLIIGPRFSFLSDLSIRLLTVDLKKLPLKQRLIRYRYSHGTKTLQLFDLSEQMNKFVLHIFVAFSVTI